MNPSRHRPLVLDGGMGHLLRRKGIEVQGPLGSMQRFLGVAMANWDAPELVIDAHLDFLRAGAEIITTNTYACVPAAIGDDRAHSWITAGASVVGGCCGVFPEHIAAISQAIS